MLKNEEDSFSLPVEYFTVSADISCYNVVGPCKDDISMSLVVVETSLLPNRGSFLECVFFFP